MDISSEEDRFGDGELTDSEGPASGVADDLRMVSETHLGIGAPPGVVEGSRGIGSASLAEVLNRQPNLDQDPFSLKAPKPEVGTDAMRESQLKCERCI